MPTPQLDLTVPERRARNGQVVETRWHRVRNINLDFDAQTIIIGLYGENGIVHVEAYTGPEALALLPILASGNYGVKNLPRQILERLIADGRLQGTVSVQP